MEKRAEHAFLNLHKVDHPHTGEVIANILMRTIEKWSITNEKVLLVITDNGSNVVKVTKLVNILPSDGPDGDLGKDLERFIDTETESESDNELDSEEERQETSLHDDINDADKIGDAIHLSHLSCLPYTLQLVVKEIDKHKVHSQVIKKARSRVKKVR